ncbi:MAG TPA: MarR family transcriptional regulator [Mycobacterium sp.]|nr:MarR family transcriptional regulator [Mycobacterium sp.]
MSHDSDAVVESVLIAGLALTRLSSRSIAAVHEKVTSRQFQTLVMLAVQGSQSQATLADQLGVHESSMSRMCDRLVARGLLLRARSAQDRRAVIVELSPAGMMLFDEVTRARDRMVEAATRQIEPETQIAAARALRRFALAAGVGAAADTTADLDGVALQIQSIFPVAPCT